MKKLLKNISLSKKLLVILFLGILLLSVIHVVLQYININVRNEEFGSFFELTNRFDFDDESSIPTWVSQFLFLLISASAILAAYLEKLKTKKVMWLLIAITALMGSIDEVATLHENILQFLHVLFFDESNATAFANAWVIIIPFVLTFALLFTIKAIKVLPKKTLQLLVIAMVIYITGAVFVDILTSSDTGLTGFKSQGLLVGLEELLELIGLSITLYAIVNYIEVNYSQKIIRAKKELLR